MHKCDLLKQGSNEKRCLIKHNDGNKTEESDSNSEKQRDDDKQ